jgi:imidazolonepropionase-like amidohydrolase
MGAVSPSLSAQSIPTFNPQELEAMITTAHNLGVKVAAHANSRTAIDNLLDLGVDSIEHGIEIFDSDKPDTSIIKKLAAAKETTKWVPTLAAYHTMQGAKIQGRSRWDRARDTFVKAIIEEGLENVACGGDTGVFNHGENAKELVLMRQLGAPWEKVLSWATLGGWECIRGIEWEGDMGRERVRMLEEKPHTAAEIDRGVPFGAIRRGWAADLVGIEGDLTGKAGEFERAVTTGVKLVIKSGEIVKWNK